MLTSLYQVHRALWLWSKGLITCESCVDAKAKSSKGGGGILKVTSVDGKSTKATNFSKARWEDEADKHILDVWACDDGRLELIKADAKDAQRALMKKRLRGKRAAAGNTNDEPRQSRHSLSTSRVVSDSDFWYVSWGCRFVFLTYSFRTTFLVEHALELY
jgi:hypothetical protein